MLDTKGRLVVCFRAVFPELSEAEAAVASVSTLAAWDSVATVTLAAAVEEEFGLQMEPEEIEKMNSFASFFNFVVERSPTR